MFKKFFFFLFWNKLSFSLSCGKSEICSGKFPEHSMAAAGRATPGARQHRGVPSLDSQDQGAIRQLEYQLHLEQRVSGLFRRWGRLPAPQLFLLCGPGAVSK